MHMYLNQHFLVYLMSNTTVHPTSPQRQSIFIILKEALYSEAATFNSHLYFPPPCLPLTSHCLDLPFWCMSYRQDHENCDRSKQSRKSQLRLNIYYSKQQTTTNNKQQLNPPLWVLVCSYNMKKKSRTPNITQSQKLSAVLRIIPHQNVRQIIANSCGQYEAASYPIPEIKMKMYFYNVSTFFKRNQNSKLVAIVTPI